MGFGRTKGRRRVEIKAFGEVYRRYYKQRIYMSVDEQCEVHDWKQLLDDSMLSLFGCLKEKSRSRRVHLPFHPLNNRRIPRRNQKADHPPSTHARTRSPITPHHHRHLTHIMRIICRPRGVDDR
jgi:hypothetical protein